MRRIQDPIYLSRQVVTDVKEHQVPGLLPQLKTMVALCRKVRLGAMAAPEVGLPYNFFIAENPDPRDHDYDVIFAPKITPISTIIDTDNGEMEITEQVMVEERGVNGKTYRVPRYKRIHMSWLYHNGHTFQQMDGEFEGVVAWMAQQQCEKLGGTYVGMTDEYEEVTLAQ